MKVLIGAALRGELKLEQYRKELDAALRSTGLRNVEFVFDLSDREDIWGMELDDCDVLLIMTNRGLSGEALARAMRLKFVQKLGMPDGIDVNACKTMGIAVSVLSHAGHIAVAEHAFMFMLCMARHAWSGHNAVLRGENPASLKSMRTSQSKRYANWLDLPRDSFGLVADRTLGLIGFGDIAREVARRARCFGMKTIYNKRNRLAPEVENEFGVNYADLPALLRTADVVSLHATRIEDEKPLIAARELELMKPDAILINTARGNQIDQAALIDFLRKRRIGGACLDVFTAEPVRADEFSGLSNVMLTPHTAGVVPWDRKFKDALINIEAFVGKGNVAGLI